jgi:hypothetical protein
MGIFLAYNSKNLDDVSKANFFSMMQCGDPGTSVLVKSSCYWDSQLYWNSRGAIA